MSVYGCFGYYRTIPKSPVLIGSPKPIAQSYHCLACDVWGIDLPPRCWCCGSSDVKLGTGLAGGGTQRGAPTREMMDAT